MFGSPSIAQRFIIIILLLACAACGSPDSQESQATEEPTALTPTSLAASQPQATPGSVEPTVENVQMLRIWWPEMLAPVDRADVTTFLNDEVEKFVNDLESPIEIDFRLKRSQDTGGIIETLGTGHTVAPGAMPDITLMRRDNLLLAVRLGLIYPLEDKVPASTISDLYDVLISLGSVEGNLYGLPFTASTSVSAYSELTNADPQSPEVMDQLVRANVDWIFPAGNAATMSPILLAQYIDAGGQVPDSNSSVVDRTPLETVFTFYQDALNAGVITDDTVGFSSLDGYQFGLADQLIVVNTDRYFSLLKEDEGISTVQIAHLPSSSGEAIGAVSGWVWVITTSDPDQQDLAMEFINWFMEPQRQYQFATTLGTLPSRQSSVERFANSKVNEEVLNAVLERGIISPNEGATNVFARAMVNGLLMILNEEGTVADAVDLVLNQFNP